MSIHANLKEPEIRGKGGSAKPVKRYTLILSLERELQGTWKGEPMATLSSSEEGGPPGW
jgi:hypothetical protein